METVTITITCARPTDGDGAPVPTKPAEKVLMAVMEALDYTGVSVGVEASRPPAPPQPVPPRALDKQHATRKG